MIITADQVAHRLGLTVRCLGAIDRANVPPSAATRGRAEKARTELAAWPASRIEVAVARLVENLSGFPAASGGGAGSGSGDRAGNLAAGRLDGEHSDPVDAAALSLANESLWLERAAWSILTAATPEASTKAGLAVERHAQAVLVVLADWARPPQPRWCKHCRAVNGALTPLGASPYGEVCRPCGDWRGRNGVLPQREIAEYLQRGEPSKIPPRLLERFGAKLPRRRKR